MVRFLLVGPVIGKCCAIFLWLFPLVSNQSFWYNGKHEFPRVQLPLCYKLMFFFCVVFRTKSWVPGLFGSSLPEKDLFHSADCSSTRARQCTQETSCYCSWRCWWGSSYHACPEQVNDKNKVFIVPDCSVPQLFYPEPLEVNTKRNGSHLKILNIATTESSKPPERRKPLDFTFFKLSTQLLQFIWQLL